MTLEKTFAYSFFFFWLSYRIASPHSAHRQRNANNVGRTRACVWISLLKIAEEKHKYHVELIAWHLSRPTDAVLHHNNFAVVVPIKVDLNKLPNKPTRIIDIFFRHAVSVRFELIRSTHSSQSRQIEIGSLGTYSCRWGRSAYSKWLYCEQFVAHSIFHTCFLRRYLCHRRSWFFARTRIKRLSRYIEWTQRPITHTHTHTSNQAWRYHLHQICPNWIRGQNDDATVADKFFVQFSYGNVKRAAATILHMYSTTTQPVTDSIFIFVRNALESVTIAFGARALLSHVETEWMLPIHTYRTGKQTGRQANSTRTHYHPQIVSRIDFSLNSDVLQTTSKYRVFSKNDENELFERETKRNKNFGGYTFFFSWIDVCRK